MTEPLQDAHFEPVHTLEAIFRAGGEAEDYHHSNLTRIALAFAMKLGVDVSLCSVDVALGSVLLTARGSLSLPLSAVP